MNNIVYGKFLALFFRGLIDLVADSLRVALLTEGHTPSASHQYFSEVEDYEVIGSGYSPGGAPLLGAGVVEDPTTHIPKLVGNSVEWENSTLSARYAVLYKDTGDSTTSPLIALFDFNAIQQSLNGTFTVQWHEDGILQLVQCAE